MKRTTILAALIAAATPALAALPPEHQRAAEFGAVITAATEVLGLVDSITFIAHDIYEAQSENCVVIVMIEDVPREKAGEPLVGPRQFRAVAQQPRCR